MREETYLGDAVYASFDGYQIWLRTGDGREQTIALEPPVFAALIKYRDNLYARLRASAKQAMEGQDDEHTD